MGRLYHSVSIDNQTDEDCHMDSVLRQRAPRYCVIGAGAAGLAALQVLKTAGHDVDCYEANDVVGGHWHHDYDSLHLITSSRSSGFDGFPMPARYPTYPSRRQMLMYLESFADHFGLREDICHSSQVTQVQATAEGGGWTVTVAGKHPQGYDAVIVANGHLRVPAIPPQAANFTGQSLHAVDYRNATNILGDRVLVVGAGNSGCDLAVDAAHAGHLTHISVRSGQIFQPKALFGRARADLAWLTRMPPWAQELVTRTLIKVIVGSYRTIPGMAKPASPNINKLRPVVNDLLPYWIRHGRITARPAIESIAGKEVRFVDGTSDEFDAILWATGYRVDLPFLDDDRLQWRDGVPLRLGATTIPVTLPDLYFVGLGAPRGPQLPTYSAEAMLIERMLTIRAKHDVDWPAQFSAAMPPTAQMDILRHLWAKELKHSHSVIDSTLRDLAKGRPVRNTPRGRGLAPAGHAATLNPRRMAPS